jgi:hypothetical protein
MSRRTRRNREETARLVREAAVRLLARDGLRGFSNSVRLDDALAMLQDETGIRLTHGSVYGRIWDDQRDFQLDVVATAIARYDGSEIASAIVEGAGRHGGTAFEAAFSAAVEVATRSRMWNLWVAAHAAAVSTPGREDDERLAEALATAQSNLVGALAAALEAVRRAGEPPTDTGSAARTLLTLLVGASVTGEPVGTGRLMAVLAAPEE